MIPCKQSSFPAHSSPYHQRWGDPLMDCISVSGWGGGGEGVYSRVGRFFILNICRLFEVALGTVRNFFLNWVWSKKLGELSLYRSLFFQNIRKSTNRPTLHSVQCTFMYNYIILLFLSYLHKCFLHFIRQTKQT